MGRQRWILHWASCYSERKYLYLVYLQPPAYIILLRLVSRQIWGCGEAERRAVPESARRQRPWESAWGLPEVDRDRGGWGDRDPWEIARRTPRQVSRVGGG
jgi:hypothetical protein